MTNKIDRVGQARHLLFNEAQANLTGLVTTGGQSVTSHTASLRPVSSTPLYGQGCVAALHGTSFTATLLEKTGFGMQCGIDVPDANAYAVEVWGEILINLPTGTILTPIAGDVAATTALGVPNTLLRPHALENGLVASGWYKRSYIHNIVLNDEPLSLFMHGFEITNTTGANVSPVMYHARFGFRTLETPAALKYYDPVR